MFPLTLHAVPLHVPEFILKIILFIYLSLAMLGWVFVTVRGLSLVVESRAPSLVAVNWLLLITVVSLVARHEL